MATTTRTKEQESGRSNGSGSRLRNLVLTPPGRQRRLPELAIGLGIVVAFGIGGLLLHLRSVDRLPALAVASPLERGDTVGPEDLQVVQVSADRPLDRMAPEQSEQVVGGTVLVDLPAGALMTEGLVAEPSAIGPEDGVVGLALEPGQYPAEDLARGDSVDVVANGSTRVVARAEVFSITDTEDSSRRLVSLRAPKPQADAIAASDPEALRLVWVAP